MAKTQRERDAEKRQEKLEQVEKQVESGSLTIRQMTDEERKRWMPPDAETGGRRPAGGKGRRRGR